LQYYLFQPTDVHIRLTDAAGKTVYIRNFGKMQEGLYETEINCKNISAGLYIMTLETKNQVRKRRVVKY